MDGAAWLKLGHFIITRNGHDNTEQYTRYAVVNSFMFSLFQNTYVPFQSIQKQKSIQIPFLRISWKEESEHTMQLGLN